MNHQLRLSILAGVALTAVCPLSALASEPTTPSCHVPAPPFSGMSTPPPPDYIVDPSTNASEIYLVAEEAWMMNSDPNGDGVLSICVEPGIYAAGIRFDAWLLSALGPLPSQLWLYSSGGRTQTEIDGSLGGPMLTPRGIDIVGPGAPDAPTARWEVYVRGFHVHDVIRDPTVVEPLPMGGSPLFPENWGGAGLRAQSVKAGTQVEWMSFSQNESANHPGGAIANFGGALYANEVLVHENRAGAAGGGAYVGQDVHAVVVNSQFTGNEVDLIGLDRNGGGLAAVGAKTVHIEESYFSENIGTRGGGVWLSDVVNADILDVGFENNSAPAVIGGPSPGTNIGVGGGLGVRHSGFQFEGSSVHNQVRVVGGWFIGNEARGLGGGMYFRSLGEGEDVEIIGVEGLSNRAFDYIGSDKAGDGGAGWFDFPTVAINDSTFRWNEAERSGGALYLTRSSVSVGSSVFEGNLASHRGGGVALASSGGTEIATFDLTEFRNNRVVGLPCEGPNCSELDLGGGGLYTSYPDPVIRDSIFDANRAGDSTLSSSQAAGGAILAQAQTRVEDSTFKNNNAIRGIGGGIGCFAPTLPLPPAFSVVVVGTSGPPGATTWFDGNRSIDPGMSMTAPYLGGGIGARLGCDVEVSNVLFESNWAPKGGGVGGESIAITVSESVFSNNGLADPANSIPATTWGGGIYGLMYPDSGRDALFDRVRFLNNDAAHGGGGIATWSAACGSANYEVTATDCEWLENRVTGSGLVLMPWNQLHGPAGGAWLNGGSDVNVAGGRFDSNQAAQAGGLGGAVASVRQGGACASLATVADFDVVDTVFRSNHAGALGGAAYFTDNAATFLRGGFAQNTAPEGGALAGRLVGYGAGMDPIGTLSLDSLALHENRALGGRGGAIHFQGYSFDATNVQVSENDSTAGSAIFGLAPGLVPSGAVVPLDIDWQYVTVAGNWISGFPQHSAGVTLWDPTVGTPGGATGVIEDSVIGFNHTPDPMKHWQAEGDQAVVWTNSITYAHNPVETNAALLVQTAAGGVTGTHPIFVGYPAVGPSTWNYDPWTSPLILYFNYYGDGPHGSPMVDPLTTANDLIGAFSIGGAGAWCPLALVPDGCVPN